MAVYFIKYKQKIGNTSKSRGTAQTYIGYCADGRIDKRLHEHKTGNGAHITRAFAEKGITFEVVFVIPNAFAKVERALKNKKNSTRLIKQYNRNPEAFVAFWQAQENQ